jgi:carbonic anhydrase/acetyltransferase-like protein (isoleucine patch superfamily)
MTPAVTIERFAGHHPQIHAEAFVHRSAVIIGQVRIGTQSSIWPNATLRGDDGSISIGSQTSIQDGVVVHMSEGLNVVTVGDRVTVGHGAILHGCTIEDDCMIGMGCIILDNAVIERGSIVGAGSLVPQGKRVPAGTVVVGNPFTVLRACTPADTEYIAYSWRVYVRRALQYREAADEPA